MMSEAERFEWIGRIILPLSKFGSPIAFVEPPWYQGFPSPYYESSFVPRPNEWEGKGMGLESLEPWLGEWYQGLL